MPAFGKPRNIMTMGWHTVMEFTPSLVGCVIAARNHIGGESRQMSLSGLRCHLATQLTLLNFGLL
jgi:hypothetical protein